MKTAAFGPNTVMICDFTRKLESFDWFSRIETRHPEDSRLMRVKLEFLLDKPVAPWGGMMADAETRIERHIFDSARLTQQYSLQKYFKEPWTLTQADAVLNRLLERYPDCYKDTFSYPYELLEFPDRLIRNALFECLVDDLTPRGTFFRDLMPWFEQGYWPCGWSGDYPDGQLILL